MESIMNYLSPVKVDELLKSTVVKSTLDKLASEYKLSKDTKLYS